MTYSLRWVEQNSLNLCKSAANLRVRYLEKPAPQAPPRHVCQLIKLVCNESCSSDMFRTFSGFITEWKHLLFTSGLYRMCSTESSVKCHKKATLFLWDHKQRFLRVKLKVYFSLSDPNFSRRNSSCFSCSPTKVGSFVILGEFGDEETSGAFCCIPDTLFWADGCVLISRYYQMMESSPPLVFSAWKRRLLIAPATVDVDLQLRKHSNTSVQALLKQTKPLFAWCPCTLW